MIELTNSLFAQVDLLIVALIFVLGIAAFNLSTISSGGSLVLVPVLNGLIGVSSKTSV